MEKKTFKLGRVEVPINNTKGPFVPKGTLFTPDKNELSLGELILLGVKNNLPVRLVGPTGCGKTAIIKWLAEQTGNGYRRLQLNGTTDIDSFVGKWLINKEGTYWEDGVLVQAMQEGLWLVLDEINAALPEVLFALQSVLDDDRMLVIAEKGGAIIKPHPNFRVFATMNPPDKYVGTKDLNKALIDRFVVSLPVDYPNPNLEKKIINQHTKIGLKLGTESGNSSFISRMVEFANVLRKKEKDNEILFSCSTRQLINWASLINDIGVKEAAKIVILNKAEEEDIQKINDELNKYFRDDENIPGGALEKVDKDADEVVDTEELELADVIEAAERLGIISSTNDALSSDLPF